MAWCGSRIGASAPVSSLLFIDTCVSARRCCSATINRLAWSAPYDAVAFADYVACDACAGFLKLIERDGLAVWVESKHAPAPPEVVVQAPEPAPAPVALIGVRRRR